MSTEKPPEKKGIFLGLSIKLIVGFTLIFTIVFAVAYYWFYSFATDTAINRVKSDLTGTLEGAVQGVDFEEFVRLIDDNRDEYFNKADYSEEDKYPEDDRYWKHANWLGTVHNIEPRAWPYTFIMGETESEMYFVGSSGAVEDPRWGAGFLEFCDPDPELCGDPSKNLSPIKTGVVDFQDYYTDQWGTWISGYAPIVDEGGQIIGGLGIDFEAEYVKEVQQGILDSIIISFVITYAVLFILVFIVARAFTGPVRELTRVAELIGEARYADADLTGLKSARLKDEITTLAEVFDDMVAKVYKREADLKKQVAELRIEIDEVKARKQVEEIVDTDFFDELQEKVKDIRARKRKKD